ncbi:hypothetical protein XENTR_v10012216 [Xenopus tropicalis]|nr:hypothetical protein XENTR_v10012216 [Xenopus tropicalis]
MESLSAAPTINTVLECTLKDDLQALKLLFEDPSEPEKVTHLLLKKDFMGRNVLFPACILGRCEVVKELIKYGASVNSLTSREAKLELKIYISFVHQSITDLEKLQGKLNKEYKNQTMAACKSKNEWLEHTKNPTTHDFVEQKLQLEAIMQTIFSKLKTSSDSGKSTSKS